jgi:peptidoglycan pentaglycine glycine transferase (the first glycine)
MEVREVYDRAEWNRLVLSLPGHDLYQAWEWAEVRSSDGWRPHRMAVFDGTGETACVALVSVLVKRLRYFRCSIAYAPAGPLVRNVTNRDAWDALSSAISRLAEAERALFVRAARTVARESDQPSSALLEAHGFRALPEDWTTWNIPRIVMRMSVLEPEEVLKRALRRRHREYIASGARRGLTVRQAETLAEGLRFRQALAVAGQRRGQPVRSQRYFERLWDELVRPGHGVLLLCEHEGRVVGGLLGARFGSRAHMLYVVVRESVHFDKLHQAPLLYWEFIRWARQIGCSSVDWGGIATHLPPREEDPGFGLYQFKLGFNARLEHLGSYHDLVCAPRRYALFRLVERRIAAPAWTWRGRLNRAFDRWAAVTQAAKRKLRHFTVSVRQRGLAQTAYWGAYGFLRPNRFLILTQPTPARVSFPPPPGLSAAVWDVAAARAYRRTRAALPPEFHQDEIDGVELCSVVRCGDEVAGLIWIYRAGDASRLFRLGDSDAELNNGLVLPQYRRRGVFKLAIASACEWLAQQGYGRVYAMVHSTNVPSRAAFEAVGFAVTADVRHFLLYRPAYRCPPDAAAVP